MSSIRRMTSKQITDLAFTVLNHGESLDKYGARGTNEVHPDDHRELISVVTRIRNLKDHAQSNGKQVDLSALTFSMQDSGLLVG